MGPEEITLKYQNLAIIFKIFRNLLNFRKNEDEFCRQIMGEVWDRQTNSKAFFVAKKFHVFMNLK